MKKGGPESGERTPEQRMREAAANLVRVTQMVEFGNVETRVSIPIMDAALVFRISPAIFYQLQDRHQELTISASQDKVNVTLRSGEGQRREEYLFLYGFIQGVREGWIRQYLESHPVPKGLLGQFPSFKEDLEQAKKDRCGFDDEDLQRLHFNLYALWFSLGGQRSTVPPWENVLSVTPRE